MPDIDLMNSLGPLLVIVFPFVLAGLALAVDWVINLFSGKK